MKVEELENVSKLAEELYKVYNTMSQNKLNKNKEINIKTIIMIAIREGMKIKSK